MADPAAPVYSVAGMYRAHHLVVVAFFLLTASLAACGGKPCPTYPHSDPEAALESYRAMRRPVRAIRAEARVDQRGRDGRIKGTVYMFVERPEQVRFDAMTQFGPAAILTSDGSEFALTDLRENRYLVGATCPSNIARLLGIPLSGEDVARLLLGETPRIEASAQSIECTGEGTYLITLRDAAGRRQEIVLDIRDADREAASPADQRLRLVRSEVFSARGDPEWRATYSEYRVLEDPLSTENPKLGVAMPFVVRFEDFRKGADVLLRVEEVDLNVDVPPEAFRQSPRPGLTPEVVECTD